MKHRPRVFGRQEAGMSLVGILVAMAISGIVVVVVYQIITRTLNTQKHLEFRSELAQLRNQLVDQLSCSKSLPPSVLQSCTNTLDPTGQLASPPYVKILNRKGVAIGKPNADGSTSLGSWRFRSRCVKSATVNVLQMAAARINAKGVTTKDPLDGKSLGWRPLFDSDSALSVGLCSNEIAVNDEVKVEAPHLASKTMSAVGSGCGDGLLATIVGGSSRLYRASVTCPANSIAINGGVECMARKKNANIIQAVVQAVTGQPKGLMVSSRPDANGRGWFMECCLQSGGVLGGLIGGQFSAPVAYADCIPEPHG